MTDTALPLPGPRQGCFTNLSAKQKRWLRVGALATILAGLFVAVFASGVMENLTVESLRETMLDLGFWGILLYLGGFALWTVMALPGMLFVGAAALAYGDVGGIAIAWIGAVTSVMLSFLLVRTVGGKLLTEIDKPWMKKLLARLERHPVRIIIVLRLITWVGPPVNYALAMSNVRTRDYLVGSAIGLVAPVAAAVIFVEALI